MGGAKKKLIKLKLNFIQNKNYYALPQLVRKVENVPEDI